MKGVRGFAPGGLARGVIAVASAFLEHAAFGLGSSQARVYALPNPSSRDEDLVGIISRFRRLLRRNAISLSVNIRVERRLGKRRGDRSLLWCPQPYAVRV